MARATAPRVRRQTGQPGSAQASSRSKWVLVRANGISRGTTEFHHSADEGINCRGGPCVLPRTARVYGRIRCQYPPRAGGHRALPYTVAVGSALLSEVVEDDLIELVGLFE